MPVTMPGSAIGSTKRSEMAFWPKKRNRDRAKAMQVPRTIASAAARRPTENEFTSASRAKAIAPREPEPVGRVSSTPASSGSWRS